MSLKWKEIALLVEEARPLLLGSAVQKIAQVKEVAAGDSFLFFGFGGLGAWRLWACLQQDQSCWVLAESDWELESQPEPSTFVMVLRKHCVGKKITGLEQFDGERLVLLHLEGEISLLFELLPKRANILLVEGWNRAERTGRCLQSYRQVSLETGGLVRLRPPPAHGGTISDEPREFGGLTEGAPYPYHQVVAEYFWGGVQKTGFASYKRQWRQAWKSQGKKVNNALTKTKGDLEESLEAELFQKRGMALVSNLYSLGPKAFPEEKSVEIDGLQIPLDLAKNYSDNAEACFRKAKKMHRAVGELEGRVAELERKAAEIAAIAEKIEKAEVEEDLEALSPAFTSEGVEIPERPTGMEEKKSAPEKKLCLEAKSSDGFLIYCGRNQEENRQVTFREAKGNDIWLHVKGVPGAHVVVKAQKNKTVPLSTLLEAAQLCLYYTKIRKGKRAEVDYTHRKNVKAIKGTIAEVTYTGNKALYVEADPDSLKKLLRNT